MNVEQIRTKRKSVNHMQMDENSFLTRNYILVKWSKSKNPADTATAGLWRLLEVSG